MAENENKKTKRKKVDLAKICQKKLLYDLVENYIVECGNLEKFPNIAGFCRYCGIGISELEDIAVAFPKEYDALCSIFEDEALNYDTAVSLIGSYLKRRLGYGDEKRTDEKDSAVNVIFKHDIMKDGE